MKTQLKYVGKNISLQVLKDTVKEKGLNRKNTLVLNPQDYNTVVLEQTQVFENVQSIPLVVNGVQIEKDDEKNIPYGIIGIT